jgi:Protein of unknown function (DUF1592)/Protein of unknown function (DUF1588)/Protein of unknown function (DUF1587)/Protein of unknown function (DUF1585)/Protein of unknown function (DUF1595)/Ca-dependent carbohydrate-binding module xylan-binding/Planctomycete cytochrome C
VLSPILLPLLACVAADDFNERARPFLRAYCAECHGAEVHEGDLTLTGYVSEAAVRADPDVWDFVRERVELMEMPPRGADKPSDLERADFLEWLGATLGELDGDGPVDPGRPVLRRLNNAQYERAVRDLFGVEFPARERFPTDGVGFGFDTVGEALALPELRLEKYIEAAETIASQVFVVDDSRTPTVRRLDSGSLSGRGRGDFQVLATNGEVGGQVSLARPGRYRMGIKAGAQQAGDESARMAFVVEGRVVHEVSVEELPDGARLHAVEVEILEVPEGGRVSLAARFLNDYYEPANPDPAARDRNLWVASIELEGPLDPPPPSAFQAELLARFGEQPAVDRERAMAEFLVRRVWRRPASDSELRRLERLPPEDAGPVERLRLMLTALLASPNFLYMVELDPEDSGPVRALTNHELAARLAAFLWSSVPDRRLDALADAGELTDPVVLEALVRTMLKGPRGDALGEDFALQWLGLRSLVDAAPDPERFPSWSRSLSSSMREESLRFFMAVLREERSVWELLDGDWTILDSALAEHYGLDLAPFEGFARVSMAATPRRGVLGQAGVLTVTSDPGRTSPVKRGKWVLAVLLGAPPPAPPPGVGTLDESVEAASASSLRERLEIHRQRNECAVCHDRMDPLGFGLEPYDAVGRWRDEDGGFVIDASGVLPNGQRFDGPEQLVEVLRQDPRFPRAVLEKLLVYGLGRGLQRGDRRTIQGLLRGLDSEAPALLDMVVAIVLSDAFRTRRVEPR